MAKRRKAWAIPKSKYASSRRRRARHVKVSIRVHRGGIDPNDRRQGTAPLGPNPAAIKRWEKAIDDAIAHKREPGGMVVIRAGGRPHPVVPVPGKGRTVSLQPVRDPRAKHQTPPTWTYGWIASSTEIAARTRAAAA